MENIDSYFKMIKKARKNLNEVLMLLLTEKAFFKSFRQFDTIVEATRFLIEASDIEIIKNDTPKEIVEKTNALISQTGEIRGLYEEALCMKKESA